MRKGIVTVLAVAIIGALGIYGKSHAKPAPASSGGQAALVQSASSTGADPSGANSSQNSGPSGIASFKDGTFTGASQDTPYGSVQVAVIISGGKITDVNFLQMPNDRGHTQEVTAVAGPLLRQETLQKQSAHIDFVSGATSTSEGYQQSLQSALDQAA